MSLMSARIDRYRTYQCCLCYRWSTCHPPVSGRVIQLKLTFYTVLVLSDILLAVDLGDLAALILHLHLCVGGLRYSAPRYPDTTPESELRFHRRRSDYNHTWSDGHSTYDGGDAKSTIVALMCGLPQGYTIRYDTIRYRRV